MNRLILVLGMLSVLGVLVLGTTFSIVEAKPTMDKNTGIIVNCKVIQGLPSCDVTDRKNGLLWVNFTNNEVGEEFGKIYGNCDSKVSTGSYDLTLNQGWWNFTVTNCNADGLKGDTSEFKLTLEGNKFVEQDPSA